MPVVAKFKTDVDNEVKSQKKAIIVLKKRQDSIIERVNAIEAKEQKQLKQEYPNGYAILGFPSEHAVITHTESVPKGVNVDWNEAKVIAITEDTIQVRFPDIKTDKGFSFRGNTVFLPKKVGIKSSFMKIDDWTLFASVLSIQKNLIVIAVGFEPKK